MAKGSVGTNTSTIIRLGMEKEQKERYQKAVKKNTSKNKASQQCNECGSNQDGFCTEFKNWCQQARQACPKCSEKDHKGAYRWHLTNPKERPGQKSRSKKTSNMKRKSGKKK